MKNVFYLFFICVLFYGCKGDAGPIGPQGTPGAPGAKGDKGDTGPVGPIGATGAVGATGLAGTNGINGATGATGPTGAKGATGATGQAGVSAVYEDFVEDISTIGIYSPKTKIGGDEFIFLFINNDGIIAPLPYKGYSYTSDGVDFVKLDCSYHYLTFTLYIDNETVIPPGATFAFRLVRVKGLKNGKINPNISYDELSRLYDLKKTI